MSNTEREKSMLNKIMIFLGGFIGLLGVSQAKNISLSEMGQGEAFNGRESVEALVKSLRSHFPAVDPQMIVAMAKIESSFNPTAYRYEKHIDDASIGLMQTLVKTAQWLYDDMGYKSFGRPSETDLYDPKTSLYFGMAYVNYLQNWKGRARSESWIVQSYNGGPNNSNHQTRNHWNKYQKAKRELYA